MLTRLASPSWRAHMPAQLTTTSASMCPWSVSTPVTVRWRVVAFNARTPSTIVTPRCRAPRASDMVTSTGLARPSLGDVEAGQVVVGAGRREELLDLAGRVLLHVGAAEPVDRGPPPVLLQPAGIGRHLDEADLFEPGREAGLRLELRVEVPRV